MDNAAASFNAVDIVVAVFVLVCIALGFKRGLIGQVVFLLTIVAVVAAVRYGYSPCHDLLVTRLRIDDAGARVCSLLIVIAVPLVVMMLVGRLFATLREMKTVAGLDRVGGALAGLIGGSLFVLVLVFILRMLPERYSPAAVGDKSWVGRQVGLIESDVMNIVTQNMGRTEGAILKARQERTSAREKWE